MGVIENIQSLINAANATTGKSDVDMTEATKSLIAGFGGGGGLTLPGFTVVSTEEVIQAEDWLTTDKGNPDSFARTYCNWPNYDGLIYICGISNNTADARFDATACINFNWKQSGGSGFGVWRKKGTDYRWERVLWWEFYVSKGAKITIIKLKAGETA